MAKDTGEIVVGANGTIRVAPTATADPADIAAAYPAGWVDLGYASEDGVTVTDSRTIENIPVWQLFYAARKIVTEKDFLVAFVLRQFNGANVRLAFGGGDIVLDGGAGKYRYDPPPPEELDERKLSVEWLDGDNVYRLMVAKTIVTENVETNIVRTGPVDLPLTMGIVGEDGVTPWYLMTDDPAFADQVGS